MLIYVKNIKKKNFLRTDRQTDGRTTQNYSSEPHKRHYMMRRRLRILLLI